MIAADNALSKVRNPAIATSVGAACNDGVDGLSHGIYSMKGHAKMIVVGATV